MSENQKQKRLELTFEDLPPRVIIFRILVFHGLKISAYSNLKEFDLFGYYKRDRHRNVWFLFQSIRLYSNNTPLHVGSVRLDFRKIAHLCVKRNVRLSYQPEGVVKFFMSLLKNLSLHSEKMYSLKSLSLPNFYNREADDGGLLKELDGAFKTSNTLSKLDSFHVDWDGRCTDVLFSSDVCCEERMKLLANSLRSLGLNFGDSLNVQRQNFDSCKLFGADNPTFPNLRKLELMNVKFEKTKCFNLPLLEFASLCGIKNVDIFPCDRIQTLSLRVSPRNEDCTWLRNVLVRSRKLKKLKVVFQRGRTCNLFANWNHNRLKNPLNELVDVDVAYLNSPDTSFNSFFSDIIGKLENLRVTFCRSFPVNLLVNSSLKKFRYDSFNDTDVSSVDFDCLEMKEMCLFSPARIIDNFFLRRTLDSFPKLKSVILVRTSREEIFSFSKWPNLDSVESMTSGIVITDRFFEHQEMKNLEFLCVSVESGQELTGKNWKGKVFPKMKKLVVYRDGATNELFENISFPNLVKLVFKEGSSISGKNWLEMKSLKVIKCSERFLETFDKQRLEIYKKEGVLIDTFSES